MTVSTNSLRWNTPAGHLRIKHILKGCVPSIEPHDYQTHGISVSLDGDDLLVTMATGSGKTGYFCFLMKVIIALTLDPSLALPGTNPFPENPAMLVVLPTKALQGDMCKSMIEWGIEAVVINGDTVQAASACCRNLWIECRQIALLSVL
ncbi:hypothetical protein BJ165DRAFT_1530847 [Panaeolus papilionaceus]|nr:hypothetical protein BJ165DRAFT_1530847 [Panaeolus papilionaceus]